MYRESATPGKETGSGLGRPEDSQKTRKNSAKTRDVEKWGSRQRAGPMDQGDENYKLGIH